MSRRRKVSKRGRSEGQLAPFVPLEHFILESAAYQSLGLCARLAYIEIARRYSGANNGTIGLSSRSLATSLRVSKATASRALSELVERGFVERTKSASFDLRTGSGRSAEWRLTRYRCDKTGELPSKAFMRWKPAKIQNAVSPQAHSGFTRDPLDSNTAPEQPEVGTSRDRNGVLGAQSGFTRDPHLEIYHAGESPAVTEPATVARNANTIHPGHTALVDWHGAALRTIEELAETIPPDLHSWAAPELGPSSSRH